MQFRLLVYSEIESLGIKGFLNQLLPKVGFQLLSHTKTSFLIQAVIGRQKHLIKISSPIRIIRILKPYITDCTYETWFICSLLVWKLNKRVA